MFKGKSFCIYVHMQAARASNLNLPSPPPSRARHRFALACILMPAARLGDPLAPLQLLHEPSLWVGTIATLAVVLWATRAGKQVRLEPWEVRAATWYLFNGLVFHYGFDFCVPVLNAVRRDTPNPPSESTPSLLFKKKSSAGWFFPAGLPSLPSPVSLVALSQRHCELFEDSFD